MPLEAGIFREIANNIAQGNCVLFLGAGASRGSSDERGAPLARLLAQKLLDDLIDSYKESPLVDRNNLSLNEIAERYEIKAGRKNLMRIIADEFKEVITPLRIHELIINIPFNIIITTNYDDLLEKKFREANKKLVCMYYKDNNLQSCFSGWDKQTTILIKLHGCIKRTDIPIVITARDYSEFLAEDSLVKNTLQFLVKNKIFLFLGYSLADLNVNSAMFLKFWERSNPCHYSIQNDPVDQWKFSYWRDQGINIYEYDALIFLKELIPYFTPKNLKIELNSKLDFYVKNFRTQTYCFMNDRICQEFLNDIKEGNVNGADFEYVNVMQNIFRNPVNQKQLATLIKMGDSETLQVILNLLRTSDIILNDEVTHSIITFFESTLAENIKHLLLDFFYNKFNADQLVTIRNLIIEYANSPQIKSELSRKEGADFSPENCETRILIEKLLNCLEQNEI